VTNFDGFVKSRKTPFFVFLRVHQNYTAKTIQSQEMMNYPAAEQRGINKPRAY
jgi:hypothetical protein